MTIQTSSHRELTYLLATVDILYSTVTLHAVHTFVNVHAVVEVRIVRYFVHTLPGQSHAILIVLR